MKIVKLLTTKVDEVGPYASIEDLLNVTIQVASSTLDAPFDGTIIIEGTLDENQHTGRWSELFTTTVPAVFNLTGYTLVALRATATLMRGGEVSVQGAGI